MIASKGQILLCAAKQGLFSVISVCWTKSAEVHGAGFILLGGQQARTLRTLIPIAPRIKSAGNPSCLTKVLCPPSAAQSWVPTATFQHRYPKALFSRRKRWNAVKIEDINKGTLISCFVFLFFRSYFILIQKSLLLTWIGASACGLFFKANLLYHFYVM